MTFDEYKEEILNGEKMEWYDTMVPRKLVTPVVSYLANMIVDSIVQIEGELSDMRNGSKEKIKREHYLENIWDKIKHLPYISNGLISDSYMIKYKRIIEEYEKLPKTKKQTNVTEEQKPKTTRRVRRSKNDNLIFGEK